MRMDTGPGDSEAHLQKTAWACPQDFAKSSTFLLAGLVGNIKCLSGVMTGTLR